MHNEVQPRVEDYGMSCNHGPPTDRYDCDAEVDIRACWEEFEEESQCLQRCALGCDKERPEVEAIVSFEGYETRKFSSKRLYHDTAVIMTSAV